MDPRVGDPHTLGLELGVEIIEVPKRATQEEVLPDIAERPLDLAFIRHDWIGASRLCRFFVIGAMVRPSGIWGAGST